MESDNAFENKKWLCNELYSLTVSNKEEVLEPIGWLSDRIIEAAQLLMIQQYPHMCGLQTIAESVFSSTHERSSV